MRHLRWLTAGESHGPGLSVILEGLPAGTPVLADDLARELRRRQGGYGRGARMAIESDRAEIRGGVRHGLSLGGPVALWVENRDHAAWSETMAAAPLAGADPRPIHRPRPGHADLAGALKLGLDDARPVLERASARETAARVAAAALVRPLLAALGITVRSHVLAVGDIVAGPGPGPPGSPGEVPWERIVALGDGSRLNCADPEAEAAMCGAIDRAREAGDTLGGRFEVVAHTPPPGLGHFSQWDLRLDGRIGQAMLSIPSARSVAMGAGDEAVAWRGSAVHDPIEQVGGQLRRPSNRAGGIEGGMTNGQEVRVRVGVKPLATLRQPLASVDLRTGQPAEAAYERSDVTVVPAAGVVGEAMLALVLADAALEKFGGDALAETLRNQAAYLKAIGWKATGA